MADDDKGAVKQEAGYGGCNAPAEPQPTALPAPGPLPETDPRRERLNELKKVEEAAKLRGTELRHVHEEAERLEAELADETPEPATKP